ncbi:MAG: DUF4058 family protein [Planctomycetaceae bacterium]|nr:DUF4058 family protein [Planctomycetaceae bacterium]
MQNPFPGMNPWLEAPGVWKGFHDAIVVKTVEQMQPSLRQQGYYIEIGERVWIADSRDIWPDNLVFRKLGPRSQPSQPAGALVADEPVRVMRFEEEVRETFAQIRNRDHELVCVIEYVSPANKRRGPGREKYQQKQREYRDEGIHLIEVDLLRAGPHVLDLPEAVVEELRPWDYLVNLVRRGGNEHEFYPVRLRDRLPRVWVPLRHEDPDAVLDLQQIVDAAYELGPYPEKLCYEEPPVPPLSEADEAWAREILNLADDGAAS